MDCLNIFKDITNNCSTFEPSRVEGRAYMFNLKYISKTQTANVISLIENVGQSIGYTFDGVKNTLRVSYDKEVKENYPDCFTHTVSMDIFQTDIKTSQFIDKMPTLMIVYENKGKFWAVGSDYGLMPSASENRTVNDAENITYISKGERYELVEVLKTDYATTKAMLEGLVTPIPTILGKYTITPYFNTDQFSYYLEISTTDGYLKITSDTLNATYTDISTDENNPSISDPFTSSTVILEGNLKSLLIRNAAADGDNFYFEIAHENSSDLIKFEFGAFASLWSAVFTPYYTAPLNLVHVMYYSFLGSDFSPEIYFTTLADNGKLNGFIFNGAWDGVPTASTTTLINNNWTVTNIPPN